jgi:hypothetical protein
VGDVGSRYALDVAHALVPELERRGYVFSAPVLAFSALRERAEAPDLTDAGPTATGDINGDGRPDSCTASPDGVRCALATPSGFTASTLWSPSRSTHLRLVDLNADGRADLCALDALHLGEPVCGLAP